MRWGGPATDIDQRSDLRRVPVTLKWLTKPCEPLEEILCNKPFVSMRRTTEGKARAALALLALRDDEAKKHEHQQGQSNG